MDKVKQKSYLLHLVDLLTGKEKHHSTTRATHWDQFSDVFMLSALTGDGVDSLKVLVVVCLHVVMVMVIIATLVSPLSTG